MSIPIKHVFRLLLDITGWAKSVLLGTFKFLFQQCLVGSVLLIFIVFCVLYLVGSVLLIVIVYCVVYLVGSVLLIVIVFCVVYLVGSVLLIVLVFCVVYLVGSFTHKIVYEPQLRFGPYNILWVTSRSINCHMALSAMNYLINILMVRKWTSSQSSNIISSHTAYNLQEELEDTKGAISFQAHLIFEMWLLHGRLENICRIPHFFYK